MNKFDEFEQIKTPANWIDLVTDNNFKITKNKKIIRAKYTLAVLLIIITVGISSITITYTLSQSFRVWLNECFGTSATITDQRDLNQGARGSTIVLDDNNQRWYVENQFIGIIDDNYNFTEAYVLKDEKLMECPIKEYQGEIDGNIYSFKYLKYENRITCFDLKGSVVEILPRTVDDMVYVAVEIENQYDLGKINLLTGQFEYITNDHISVNPIASPKQTNILINKNDQMWENYNTETGITNKITNIDPYMHSNTVTFIDENTVVTYDGSDPILVDVLNDTVMPLDKFPLEGTMVNIDNYEDAIIFTNLITKASCKMENVYILGTYCSLDYIGLFNQDDLYLYDINNNRIVDLNSNKDMDEKLTGVSFIDKEHLLISTDKRIYILVNNSIKD